MVDCSAGSYYQVSIHEYKRLYLSDNATGTIYGDTVIEQNTFEYAGIGGALDFETSFGLDSDYYTNGTMRGDVYFINNDVRSAIDDVVNMTIATGLYGSYTEQRGHGVGVIDIATIIDGNNVDDCGRFLLNYTSMIWSHDSSNVKVNAPLALTKNEVRHGTYLTNISVDVRASEDAIIAYAGPISIGDNTVTQLTLGGLDLSHIYVASFDNGRDPGQCRPGDHRNDLLVIYGYDINIGRTFRADDDSASNVQAAIGITNNKIQNEKASSFEGTVNVMDEFGYMGTMNSAKLTVTGDVKIKNNDIKTSNIGGISYYMRPYTSASVGAEAIIDLSAISWSIENNTIVMSSTGKIGIKWESEYRYFKYSLVDGGNLSVTIGDVLVNGNTIDVTGDYNTGIFVNVDIESFAYNGGTMTSMAGSFLANQNTISITGDNNMGLEMYVDYLVAHGGRGNATTLVGAISANGNAISIVGNNNQGLQLDPDGTAAYSYICAEAVGSHDFPVSAYVECTGDMNAVGNIISVDGSGNRGLDVDWQHYRANSTGYLANATVLFDINVLENIVTVVNDGANMSYGFYSGGCNTTASYDRSYALAKTNLLIKDNAFVQTGAYTTGLEFSAYSDFSVNRHNFIETPGPSRPSSFRRTP